MGAEDQDDWSWFDSPAASAPGRPVPQDDGGPGRSPSPAPGTPDAPGWEQWDAVAVPPGATALRAPAAPMWALWAGGAVALVGAALALIGRDSVAASLLGWLLAGFGAVGLVTAYTYLDTRARADPWYLPDPTRDVVRLVVLLLCVLGVVTNAYLIADWWSRR